MNERIGYRLRLESSDAPRWYLLKAGTNVVGSDPSCDVRIQGRGVSRRHAVLTLGDDELRLSDLDSKNGTTVNGARVLRTRVWPGDDLGVGALRLRLEAVDPDDAELALAFDAGARLDSGTLLGETSTLIRQPSIRAVTALDPSDSARWLRILGEMIEVLWSERDESIAVSVERLRELLGAPGVAFGQLAAGSELSIVAASGEVGGVLPASASASSTALAAGDLHTGANESGQLLTVCRLEETTNDATFLLVWGDFDGREHSEAPLGLVARLLDFRLPRAAFEPVSPESAQLCFPVGFVRGTSAVMSAVYRQIARLAPSDLPVLLAGETGVGKEHLARMVHESSTRRRGPWVTLNCAAIPHELLEAELFGIGKGVATGVSRRRGKFLEAHGGTLFLDEISEMPADLQAKLLRALQGREIQPLGESPVNVDVRIVAATNADLASQIEAGLFRQDLYYRLAGSVVRVPSLRERREEIPRFIEHFLRRFCDQASRRITGVTIKALRTLTGYPWPGNVRELEHEIRRLVQLCDDGQPIDSTLLSDTLGGGEIAPAVTDLTTAGKPVMKSDPSDLNLENVERRTIEEALRRSAGNKTLAAKWLGLSRTSLWRRIERFGLSS